MYDEISGMALIENAYVITGDRRRHDKGFVKVFELFSKKCLEDFGVLNGELKLLVYMMGKLQDEPMNTEGWIDLETDVLLEHLHTTRSTYFSYLTKLKKLKYIEQKRPRTSNWRINPEFIYRGDLVESQKRGKVHTRKRQPKKEPIKEPVKESVKPAQDNSDLDQLFPEGDQRERA